MKKIRDWKIISIDIKDGKMEYVVSNGTNEIKGTRAIEKNFGKIELEIHLKKFLDRVNFNTSLSLKVM